MIYHKYLNYEFLNSLIISIKTNKTKKKQNKNKTKFLLTFERDFTILSILTEKSLHNNKRNIK